MPLPPALPDPVSADPLPAPRASAAPIEAAGAECPLAAVLRGNGEPVGDAASPGEANP